MPGVLHLLINLLIMFAQMLTSVLRRDLNARSSPLIDQLVYYVCSDVDECSQERSVLHLLINWFIMFAQMLTSALRRDLNARSSPLID